MKRSDPYRGDIRQKSTDRCPHTDRSPREMDWLRWGQRKTSSVPVRPDTHMEQNPENGWRYRLEEMAGDTAGGTSRTSRKRKVLGITSRGPESDFSWLEYFVKQKYSNLFEVKYLPISDYNREEWEEDVRLCSAVILYHTEHQGEFNITDVDGALYDSELYYMNNILGREKVLVMLDNISEEERCRILKTPQSLSAHLIFIPEKNKSEATKKELTEFFEAVSKGVKTSQQKKSTGVIPITLFKQSQSPPPPYKIGIFSRSAESNYTWLMDSLKADDHMGSLDIKAVCITNNYKTFSSALQTCCFAILYHTKKHGRLNITNVEDSLYDNELQDMSNFLGKENVIVVADDLNSSGPEDKEWILKFQPHIHTFAKDLFLFKEKEKHRENLEKIGAIIQRSKAKHNVPDTVHLAAHPREFTIKNHGYSDYHKNRTAKYMEGNHYLSNMTNFFKGARTSSSKGSGPFGDTDHRDTINNSKGKHEGLYAAGSTSGKSSKPSPSPLQPYQIGIFSRSAESSYTWLVDSLKKDDYTGSLDIKSVCITNNNNVFSSALQTCRFAILYHTLNHGRLNITNGENSLYDNELREMSNYLGKENVIVVADDLRSSGPEDKERILKHQPRIHEFANDLFLFTEHKKPTANLKTIREIIWKCKNKQNGPDKKHQAAPPRERESSMKNDGSADSYKNKTPPKPAVSQDSPSSHSGSVGYQTQKTDTAEPESKKSRTLSSGLSDVKDHCNNPITEHQAAPHSNRESFVRNPESSIDIPMNRIPSEQVYTPDSSPSCSKSVGSPIAAQKSDVAEQQFKRPKKLSSGQTNPMKEKYDLPEDLHPDLINKKLNDLQQEKQELENRVKSLTLDKDRAVEEMKKIIQREEIHFSGQGKEIGERENVLQQQETQRKEIGLDILSQEGGEGAHGHETLLRSQETFPDKGNHLQKTAGSSCLKDMNMDELITVIKKIINEKDLTIERQGEEIKKYEILGKRTCQKN